MQIEPIALLSVNEGRPVHAVVARSLATWQPPASDNRRRYLVCVFPSTTCTSPPGHISEGLGRGRGPWYHRERWRADLVQSWEITLSPIVTKSGGGPGSKVDCHVAAPTTALRQAQDGGWIAPRNDGDDVKSKRRTEAYGAAFASAGRKTGSARKYLRLIQDDYLNQD